MMRQNAIVWLLLPILAAVMASTICQGQQPLLPNVPILISSPPVKVVRVIDGDTLVLMMDGKPTTVRLIGVDTPETVHPNKPVERFGREATVFLRGLVEGKVVRVEYEPGPSHLDRYGRTLAYLYLDSQGDLFVNREIIARGFGYAYVKYPFKFMDDFRAAERSAREHRVGLWAEPGPRASTALTSSSTSSRTASGVTIVYVTRTGKKYHRAGCRSLAKSADPIPLDRAELRYTPCAVCKPPTIAGER